MLLVFYLRLLDCWQNISYVQFNIESCTACVLVLARSVVGRAADVNTNKNDLRTLLMLFYQEFVCA
jgi:hypothetical protein